MTDDDGYFGGRVAASYDQEVAGPTGRSSAPPIDLLLNLRTGGRMLEFAIGTGRSPCRWRSGGYAVAGIELSRAMAAQLRAKPGGAAIEVTIGDMADARVAGPVRARLSASSTRSTT